MKVSYKNRYGDNIIFEKLDDKTVRMYGYNPSWIRTGWENNFQPAYDAYLADCEAMTEPDVRLLYEDTQANKLRPMKLEEFRKAFYSDTTWHKPENPFSKYYPLIVPEGGRYSMVDPSGGPAIYLRGNLKYYFNSKENMIVESIDIIPGNYVIFKIR